MTKKEMLLVQLMEEAAEVAQEASKCLRFGPTEQMSGCEFNNIQRVINEFNDLYAMMTLLQLEGVIQGHFIDQMRVTQKLDKVQRYMDYSIECGTIDNEGTSTNG